MGIEWQSGFHTGGKREPTRRETDVGNGGLTFGGGVIALLGTGTAVFEVSRYPFKV